MPDRKTGREPREDSLPTDPDVLRPDATKASSLDVDPPSERVDDETDTDEAKVTRRQE